MSLAHKLPESHISVNNSTVPRAVGVTGNPALEKLLANLYSRLDRGGNPFLPGDLSMDLGATSEVQLRAQSAPARCSRFGGSI